MTQTNDELSLEDPPEEGPAPTPFTPPVTLGGLPPLEISQHRPAGTFGQPRQPSAPQPGRRSSSLPKFSSLGSLYSYVPELGTDQAQLRVERVTPEWIQDPETGNRKSVAGIIAYLTDTPSTEDFVNRFGGRKFHVYAERLTEDKERGGEPRSVDVAYAEIQFPVDPNLDELPIIRDEPMDPEMEAAMGLMGGGGHPYNRFNPRRPGSMFFSAGGGGGKPSDMLDAVRMGVDISSRNAQPRDDSTLHFLKGLSDQQMESVRQFADAQAALLQRQIEERDRELAEMRREIREQRERPTPTSEILTGVGALMGNMRGSASEMEASQLRATHDREMERLTRRFDDEKESMRREHEREMTALRASFETEKNMLRQSAEADRNRFSERERDQNRDFERREQSLRDEMERREMAAKRDAERETASIRQMFEMQILTLKQGYEERIRAQEANSTVMNKMVETTGSAEIRSLQRDLAQAMADRDRLRIENEEYRAKINKTPIEAIQEAQQLTSLLGGSSEEPRTGSDRIIDALASTFETGGPALLAGLGGLAQNLGNRAVGAAPGKVTATVQQVQHSQPPRFVDDDAAPMGSLTEGEQPPPKPKKTPQPSQQPAQPPAQAPAQPEQDPWAGFEWTDPLPKDALYAVFSIIENTIVEGHGPDVARDRLAEGLGGIEVLRAVIGAGDADKVIQSVAKAPATKSSHLNTSKGRKFIRELWALIQEPTE